MITPGNVHPRIFPIRMFLLILISVGFVSTLYLTVSNHRNEEVHYSTLFRMAPWSAWQAEREYYNFRESLYLYTHQVHGHDKDSLLLRYEILLSRLKILQEGGVAELIGDMPGFLDKVQALEEALLAFEQRLRMHESGDLLTLAEIDRAVRVHGPFLRTLSDRSVLGPEIGRMRQNIFEAYRNTRTSSWALSGFSLLLVLLLIIEIAIGRRSAREAELSSRKTFELAEELGKFKARVDFFNNRTGLAYCVGHPSKDGLAIKHVSRNLKEVLGYDIKDNLSPNHILQIVHPADRGRVREACLQTAEDGRPAIEFRVQHSDGKIRWVAHTSIITRTSNDSQENLEVFQDVTEQRMAIEVMQQSSRLLTLGELAAGLAHEINQPLSVIRLSAFNALNRIDRGNGEIDAAYLQKKLDRIVQQVIRAERLTEQMKVFSRSDTTEFSSSFRISCALESVKKMIYKEFYVNNIDINCKLPSDDIRILGNIEMLEQALMNIILNARDAIRDAIDRCDIDRGRIDINVEEIPRTRRVQINISDNGGGVSADIVDTMFAPFITTKPPGKGTGLGLWIASALVTRLGGTITSHNSKEGAVFSVQMPTVKQRASHISDASRPEA